ncbi:hypothetical protein PR001_g31515 [Phytophthora rubi]|nr:hypothetical protein PR001_g31515 [Phytophthora rubi]
MRLHFALLWLAVVAVVLRAEASAIIQSAPDATDLMLFDADKDVELTNRALRTDGSKNEERGGFPGMSKFAGLLSKAGPSKNIANKLWLRSCDVVTIWELELPQKPTCTCCVSA